jgi:hypothetical protein
MMDKPTPETNGAYHADASHTSNSMLKVFANSPALYNELYVAQTRPKPQSTWDMIVGSATHTLFLQPELFAAEFAVAPKCDRRTTQGKADWAKFQTDCDGKTIIDADGYELAKAMVAALFANPIAKALREIADPIIEKPLRWKDEASGLLLKAKPDMYVPAGMTEWNLCVDLKTTIDPGDGFCRQCASLGYHKQAAFYLVGCNAVYTSDVPTKFLVLAVGKEEPHDVFPYCLGREWIVVGEDHNAFQRKRLAECYESGQWYAPESRTITELNMPAYLKYTKN